MTDERSRTLEGAADRRPDAVLLQERLRAGRLRPERLRLAALLGDEASRTLLGDEAPSPIADDHDLLLAAEGQPDVWDAAAILRLAVGVARAGEEEQLLDGVASDPATDQALEAVEAWLRCPCLEHAQAASRFPPSGERFGCFVDGLRERREAVKLVAWSIEHPTRTLRVTRGLALQPVLREEGSALAALDELLAGRGRRSGHARRALDAVRRPLAAWALGVDAVPSSLPWLDVRLADLQARAARGDRDAALAHAVLRAPARRSEVRLGAYLGCRWARLAQGREEAADDTPRELREWLGALPGAARARAAVLMAARCAGRTDPGESALRLAAACARAREQERSRRLISPLASEARRAAAAARATGVAADRAAGLAVQLATGDSVDLQVRLLDAGLAAGLMVDRLRDELRGLLAAWASGGPDPLDG